MVDGDSVPGGKGVATMVIQDMDRKARMTVVFEARDAEDLVMQMRRMISQIELPANVTDESALPLPDIKIDPPSQLL